jgi:chromosome segregation ATPase
LFTSGLLYRSKKYYNLVKSYYTPMKSSISAKIPTELYIEVQGAIKEKKYTSNTECIIEGLNLLLRNQDQKNTEDEDLLQKKEKEIQNLQNEVNRGKGEIQVLQEEVKRSKEEVKSIKEDYINQIKSLEERLKGAPDIREFSRLQARSEELEKHNETLIKELKMNEEHQKKRIEDLKSHIYSLDNQMRTKDDQIEKLNENMHKQAVHLQTLLNQKAIEAPGNKKAWYKFW